MAGATVAMDKGRRRRRRRPAAATSSMDRAVLRGWTRSRDLVRGPDALWCRSSARLSLDAATVADERGQSPSKGLEPGPG